jgi:hypothetical protein
MIMAIIISGYFISKNNFFRSTTKDVQLTRSPQISNNTPDVKNINNSVNNADGQIITNVFEIKQSFANKKYINSLKGYLIYKTTSCSFITTDPPYPPESMCSPDSGYFILSDTNNSLKTNPDNERTILNENQILVFYVPDTVINSLSIGKVYNIEGSYKIYNSLDSIKYFKIQNSIDCDKIKKEITILYEVANYCSQDSDCVSSGCPAYFYNKNANLNEIRLKEKLFYDHRCPAEAICKSPESYNLKCVENKCIF